MFRDEEITTPRVYDLQDASKTGHAARVRRSRYAEEAEQVPQGQNRPASRPHVIERGSAETPLVVLGV